MKLLLQVHHQGLDLFGLWKLVRQIFGESLEDLVSSRPNGLFAFPQSVFYNGALFGAAKDHANGSILARHSNLIIQGREIELHFAHEFRLELANLQIHREEAS